MHFGLTYVTRFKRLSGSASLLEPRISRLRPALLLYDQPADRPVQAHHHQHRIRQPLQNRIPLITPPPIPTVSLYWSRWALTIVRIQYYPFNPNRSRQSQHHGDRRAALPRQTRLPYPRNPPSGLSLTGSTSAATRGRPAPTSRRCAISIPRSPCGTSTRPSRPSRVRASTATALYRTGLGILSVQKPETQHGLAEKPNVPPTQEPPSSVSTR